MPEPNPLDVMAEGLAEWADNISTRIADGIKGGFNAPGAAQISERQKLAFYTRQMFNADGTPNYEGRQQTLERLGPDGFAEVFSEVASVHPELMPPEIPPNATLQPTGVPGVREVVERPPIDNLRPTGIEGVSEVVS